MKNLTEKTIIIQMQNGDFEHFNIIYEKYNRKVFFIILKMLKDEALSEDITQEVFFDIFKGIKTLKEPEFFNAWLTKITLNKVNLTIKKKIFKKNILTDISINSLSYIKDDSVDLESNFLKNEFFNEFFNLINKLPKKNKRILVLYYYKNLSLKEISAIENIPIGTVKSRLFSSRKMLKELIPPTLAFA